VLFRKIFKYKLFPKIIGVILVIFLFILDQKKILDSLKTNVQDVFVTTFAGFQAVSFDAIERIKLIFDFEYKYTHLIEKTKRDAFFWQLEAQRLRYELQEIQKIIKYKSDINFKYVACKMISLRGGDLDNHKVFLTIGKNSGVQKNNIVISNYGLVGKVIRVGNSTAEVMLLSHPQMAVPVFVERTNAVGIASGDGLSSSIRLNYIDEKSVKNGDRILTSGHGGLYPRGFSVGYAFKKQSTFFVQPLSQVDQDFFVYVMDASLEEGRE
jgi:rod shape-determining protein MreC